MQLTISLSDAKNFLLVYSMMVVSIQFSDFLSTNMHEIDPGQVIYVQKSDLAISPPCESILS